MRFSVAITIHDEERNIGRLLGALLDEPLGRLGLDRIVVVSSGSRDRSEDIVREFQRRSPAILLIVEAERSGKASAINLALAQLRAAEVVVLMSGDVIPAPGAIAKLLHAFDDPGVGMVGGRPVPAGSATRLAHRIARLQWDLHHEVSLRSPKLGEVVAFRNVVDSIPADTAVDEASLEAMVRARGFRCAYVPDAVIWNKGPDTVADLVKQRRRIAAGHAHLAATKGYRVSTDKPGLVAGATLRVLARSPARVLTAVAAAGIEAYARALGHVDLKLRGRNPYVWDVASSTKDLGDSPRATRTEN